MGRLFNIRCGRNGGLVFWEIGRFGGSFYLQSHAANMRKWAERDERALIARFEAAIADEFVPDHYIPSIDEMITSGGNNA